jgi:hypothetical protein
VRPSDVLVAYGLAAYLREGQPGSFGAFVDAAHASDDPVEMVRRALGTDLAGLARRLRRWMAEQPE